MRSNKHLRTFPIASGNQEKQKVLSIEIDVKFLLIHFCWRAIARQHTILYNRAKSAKFVRCKIGDMRSRFRF